MRDMEITPEEYNQIMECANDDSHIDNEEKALLAQFQQMLGNGTIKRVKGWKSQPCPRKKSRFRFFIRDSRKADSFENRESNQIITDAIFTASTKRDRRRVEDIHQPIFKEKPVMQTVAVDAAKLADR